MLIIFYGIENRDISLLGKKTAQRIGALKLGVSGNQIEKNTVFNNIKIISISLSINSNIKPIRQPLRRVPIEMEDKVEERLQEALEMNFIELVEPVNGFLLM